MTPEPATFLKNRASHQTNLAPLICRVARVVRARGRWAWIPGWEPSVFVPTSDSKIENSENPRRCLMSLMSRNQNSEYCIRSVTKIDSDNECILQK